MMRIDIATLFPEMCEAVLSESMIGRARSAGLVEIYTHNIRDYTLDKHRRVDDAPYGGGKGMLMQAEPIYRCYQSVLSELSSAPKVIYLSPQGKKLHQSMLLDFAEQSQPLFLLCGHYEGVDERILEEIVDLEISVGDYVLTGGELPALLLTDGIVRLLPGVLPDPSCYQEESHFAGLLEYPQYTRPENWHGRQVPSVLLSGHHANIEQWRMQKAIERTSQKRPDMLSDLKS